MGVTSKVVCPKCGAHSGKDGFGQEADRVSGSTGFVLSADPAITKRRNKARALKLKNITKKL